MPAVWCWTTADLTVHQPSMQATDPEGLNGRLLAKGAELAVQLTEQGEIGPRDSRKHKEQT